MDRSALLLALVNLAFVGALPRIFFQPGRLNARWWLTAAPFLGAAGLLVAALAGALSPALVTGASALRAAAAFAVLCCAASIALIGFTLGAHRVPLALWHQDDDTPVELVTWGPYARVRHPFYTAFLIGLFGAAAALPHWAMLALWCYAALRLNATARHEEARLLASHVGREYERYMRRTGRFLPSRAAHANADPPANRRAGRAAGVES
jgi:protein-S-isoprenylcysteine O-methyltransferase Ste14